MIAPILRERYSFPPSAQDRESQDKIDHLSATVHTCTQDVVVLDEPIRLVLAQPELRDEAGEVVEEEGGVSTTI